MARSANGIVKLVKGDFTAMPVLASATIYEASMVGLSSGYSRALVAGDVFVGHAQTKAVEATAVNGAIDVDVRRGKYRLEVAVTGVTAVTDVGKDVYASDDATYTLTKGANSLVGKIVRWVTSTTCVVEFEPLQFGSGDVADHEHTAGTDGGPLTAMRVITSIDDVNGLELLKVTAAATAVNEFTLANAATGSGPSLIATGGDTDVDATLAGKGTGSVILGQATSTGVKLAASQPILDENGAELVKFVATGTAVNEVTIANAATGNAPVISATGETDVGLTLTPKGTGVLLLNGPVQITDAKDVVLGSSTGTKIGTATSQKLGFFNATPVVQQPKASFNNWAAATDVAGALAVLGLVDAA